MSWDGGFGLQLAAEAGTAALDVQVVVVIAEVVSAKGDSGASVARGLDVSAELHHRHTPSPLGMYIFDFAEFR
jgi:hypothetical protein